MQSHCITVFSFPQATSLELAATFSVIEINSHSLTIINKEIEMNSSLFVFLGAFLYTWYYGGRILFLKAYDIHQILQVLFTKLVKSVSEKWSITNRKTLLNLKINENTNDCFYCVSIKKLVSRVLELMIDYNTSYCNFKWCEFDRVWKYGAVYKLNNLLIKGHLLLIFALFIFISCVHCRFDTY